MSKDSKLLTEIPDSSRFWQVNRKSAYQAKVPHTTRTYHSSDSMYELRYFFSSLNEMPILTGLNLSMYAE